MTLHIDKDIKRPTRINIDVDGKSVAAYPGESLASALLAAGIRTLRHSPVDRQARGFFCMMGVCQECLVIVNGHRTLACQVAVQSGMVVTTGDWLEN